MAGTNVGSIEYVARINTNQLRSDAAKTEAAVGSMAKTTSAKMGAMAKSIGASASKAGVGILAMGAAFSFFAKDAIKRVDTLNNFPKVMSNMGISAEEAAKASKKMTDGILGLPTSLDQASLAVQRLTSKTGDVNKATDVFLAMNNAIIAGGAPMELQATAMEQFSQSFAKGKPDMMEWRSMLAAMPAQLGQVAKSMGLASAEELGEKLRDGTISMEEFSNQVIKLNSKGQGGLPTLAEQAKNATSGIGTAMTNARTAIVRGIAAIIQSIGASNIGQTITDIGLKIEGVAKFIAANLAPIAVFIGTVLTAAFATWAVAVIAATWPILAIAAAITGLFLLYKRFQPQVQQLTEKFREFWQLLAPMREFIAGQLKAAFNDLINAYKRMYAALAPHIPLILKVAGVIAGVLIVGLLAVIVVIARVVGWIATLISKFWQFSSAVASAVGRASSAIFGLQKRIVSVFAGAGSWLVNAGSQIIQGLINGIMSKFREVQATLSSLTDKLPDWKGPMSTDKKILVESGQAVIQGFNEGLVSQFSTVQKTLGGLTNSIGGTYNPSPVGMRSINAPVTGTKAVPTNNIGQINISSDIDGKYWLRKLTQIQEADYDGLTAQGAI